MTEYRPRIADFPANERPRERLAAIGADRLTDAELLAILLRVGVKGENAVRVAQRLRDSLGGLAGLHTASLDDLRRVKGIGLAKAAQLKAAIELGRRVARAEDDSRPVIRCASDAANLLMHDLAAFEQEYLFVILLNTRNRVIGRPVEVYHGSVRRMAA